MARLPSIRALRAALGEQLSFPGFAPGRHSLDDAGFYSPALEAALNLPSRPMTSAEALNTIAKGRGVEGYLGSIRDEMNFLKLREMFGGQRKVSPGAIADYIENNRLKLNELYDEWEPTGGPYRSGRENFRDDDSFMETEWEGFRDGFRDNMDYILRHRPEDFEGEYGITRKEWENYSRRERGEFIESRFDDYLTDNENELQRSYDEHYGGSFEPWVHEGVRTGPGQTRLGDEDDPSTIFEQRMQLLPGGLIKPSAATRFSGHWSDPGVIVSNRGEYRTDAGTREQTLFSGEVQSDMAKRALRDKVDLSTLGQLRNVYENALARYPNISNIVERRGSLPEGRSRFAPEALIHPSRRRHWPYTAWSRRAMQDEIDNLSRREASVRAITEAPLMHSSFAPLRTGVRAALLRAVRDPNVKSLSYPTPETSARIQGNSRAAHLYGTVVPSEMRRIGSFFGSRQGANDPIREGQVEVPHNYYKGAADANFLDITPEMRERLLREGLPYFGIGGLAALEAADEYDGGPF